MDMIFEVMVSVPPPSDPSPIAILRALRAEHAVQDRLQTGS